MNIDIAKLKHQAEHVNNVMIWLRSLAFNERLLKRIQNGKEDSFIYSEDRIKNKIAKLMKNKYAQNTDYLKSKDFKKKMLDLEDEMDIYRPLVLSKEHRDNVEYHEKLSDLTDKSKEAEKDYYISLENIDRDMFEFNSNIYKLILDGTDMEMVYYVLNKFDKLQNGKITYKQGAKLCSENAEEMMKHDHSSPHW